MPRCPNCNAEYEEGKTFCGQCGAPLPTAPTELICPQCHLAYPEGKTFCRECGSPLVAKGVSPAAAPVAKEPKPVMPAPPAARLRQPSEPATRAKPPVVEEALPGPAPRREISLPMVGGALAVVLVAVAAGVLLLRGRDAAPPATEVPGSGATVVAAGPTEKPTGTALPEPTDVPSPSPESGPVTVRVAADGSGDYASLEAAADAVPADSTVILAAGTYRLTGALDVAKSLSLSGAGMDETFVVGQAGEQVVRFTGPGSFAAEGITFRYEGVGWAEVVLVEGGEVDLSRCRFTCEGGSGTEERKGDGLVLSQGAVGRVKECRAEGNSNGIRIRDQAHPTLEDNVCTDNAGTGILLMDAADATLVGNECSSNGGSGIQVHDAQPTLEGNRCTNNEGSGISYYRGAGGIARGNECSDNGGIGIGVSDSHPTLEGNVCRGNHWVGIAFTSESGGVARGNECAESQTGILVEEGSDPELEDNDCHDNRIEDISDDRS